MNDRSRVSVLVPAAGKGLRLGGERKQFRQLGGAPVLVRTLEIFEHHPEVGSIVVAAPPQDVDMLYEMLHREGIHKLAAVVPGGANRQESVSAALKSAPAEALILLVHDAVRPFLPSKCVTAVIDAARKYGAAALGLPVSDTLRKGIDDVFTQTMRRTGLYRMQTPQAFRRDWFVEAHRAAGEAGYVETDDVGLVQRIRHPVHIVEGSATNVKITTPSDWALAEALWATIHASVSP